MDSLGTPSPEPPADPLVGIAGIRAHRVEVEALLAFTHAAEGESKALAWWRLQQARQSRRRVVGAAADRLPPLPTPPPGALTKVQAWRLRLGWLHLVEARPAKRLARHLPAR